ncbi:MAG: type II secretion system F family protein, partial [Gemmatimonadaceae bacterium]|nr:type II secretion system F family protein [Gemmatimonadaceae bacterium]
MEVRLQRASTITKKALPPDDLAVGLRVLAALLEANVPLARALGMLDDLVPSSWTPVLGSITESIRSGHSLAAALSAAPASFPPVVLGMLQAGEGGSGLATAVRRAADLTESSARTRAAIRSALAYPIILAFAGSASIALLVGVVLPRFGAILSDLGQPLPTTTRI